MQHVYIMFHIYVRHFGVAAQIFASMFQQINMAFGSCG